MWNSLFIPFTSVEVTLIFVITPLWHVFFMASCLILLLYILTPKLYYLIEWLCLHWGPWNRVLAPLTPLRSLPTPLGSLVGYFNEGGIILAEYCISSLFGNSLVIFVLPIKESSDRSPAEIDATTRFGGNSLFSLEFWGGTSVPPLWTSWRCCWPTSDSL